MRYFPMLPVKYKERYKKIKYPCYVQPKLDGTRVLAYLYRKDDNEEKFPEFEVILYTRELKDVPGKEKIKKQLFIILKELYDYKNNESIYIDFEFYKFGKELQDISSALRNEKTNINLQCWIFDIFYPSKLKTMKFEKRLEYIDKIEDIINLSIYSNINKLTNVEKSLLNFTFNKENINILFSKWLNRLKKNINNKSEKYLKETFKKEQGIPSLQNAIELEKALINLKKNKMNEKLKEIKIPIYGNIVIVPTIIADNRLEEEFLYWGFIDLGFEGTIVRNINGIYKASSHTKNSYLRSMDVQKRKQLFSKEYELFDYSEGKKGRDKGAIIWIFKINNKIVRAVPKNSTIDERKKLFSKLKKNKNLFDNEYKGKLMTVEFEDISKDSIPQRLKVIGLRPFL